MPATNDDHAMISALMETAAQAILAVDTDGRIVMCNAAAETMFGYSRPELLELRVEDLIPGRHRRQHVQHRAGYFAHPRNRPMAAGLDLKALRKDGTEFPVEISLSFAATTADQIAVAFVSDITERKRTEDSLRRSEEYFRALVERSYDNIAVLNADQTVRYVSPSIERMTGYKPEEHVDGNIFDGRIHPDDIDAAREAFRQAAASANGSAFITCRVRHKDGAWRHIEAAIQNLMDNPAVAGIVVNSRDVTEQKLANLALRESEAAARAAHEKLRELTRYLVEAQEQERRRISMDLHDDVLQNLGLLASEVGAIGESLAASPDEIRSKLRSVAARVNSVSDDVRSTAYRLHPSVLEHLGLVDALQSLCYDVSAQNPVQVTFRAMSVPDRLPADVALGLYRVAQECLRNVTSHSGAARALVRLQGTQNGLCLIIEDFGKGFDRASAIGRRGLGLISMEERTRAMNGTFSIKSRRLAGTRVEVRVPLAAEAVG